MGDKLKSQADVIFYFFWQVKVSGERDLFSINPDFGIVHTLLQWVPGVLVEQTAGGSYIQGLITDNQTDNKTNY